MTDTKSFIWVFILGFGASLLTNHVYTTYVVEKPVTKKQIVDTMDRKLKVV